jgi:uncharacterized membrane protein
MDLYYNALDVLRTSLLLAGSVVIFVGVLQGALEALRTGSGGPVARRIMADVALGLEFFIGASILNLILYPTWPTVATTALTIAVRTLTTLSLNRLAQQPS